MTLQMLLHTCKHGHGAHGHGLPAGQREFKAHMSKPGPKSFTQRLSDFHVLLWLSGQASFDLRTDMAALAEAVRDKTPIPEGYQLILDSLLQS